jgi:hypothetical protein
VLVGGGGGIDALSSLAGESAPSTEVLLPLLWKNFLETGVTSACRDALIAGARPMNPIEVKDQMEMMHFDLSKYDNPLASIDAALRHREFPYR